MKQLGILELIKATVFNVILFATTPAWSNERCCELIFENQSTINNNICVYQNSPKSSSADVITLAWFCQAFPQHVQGGTSRVVFNWTEDYEFIMSESGKIGSAISFYVSQILPLNLNTLNTVTLARNDTGNYTFTNQRQGIQANILSIEQDQSIIPSEVFVGISMAGSSIALVKALPNLKTTFELNGNPIYWIVVGNYKTGQVLNLAQIDNPQKIEFQGNINSMTALLRNNNTWCIEKTGQNHCDR